MKRKDLIGSAVVASVAAASPAYAATGDRRGSLELAEQGTFYVGGERQFRTPGSSLKNDERSLPGDIAFNQMYVEYKSRSSASTRTPS